MNPRTCPICAGTGRPLYNTAEYRFFRCAACRTAYVDPLPTNEALRAYYDRYHLTDDEGGLYDQVERRMTAGFNDKIERIRRATGNQPGRLLDVGCGKGFFVKAAQDAGMNAQGQDLSSSGVQFAIDKLAVKATCGLLADLRQQLGRFDTITFWATAEHLPDPKSTFRDMFEMLTPGGMLFITTCAGDDRIERMLPVVTQWFDPPQHPTIFSKAGMERALVDCGFQVVGIDMNYEYTRLRRWVRMARNLTLAMALRMVATAGRMSSGPSAMTRLPIGNDLIAVARRPVAG